MKQALLMLFILTTNLLFATDSIPPKRIAFKTRIFYTEDKMLIGYLTKVTDSTVIITDAPVLYGRSNKIEPQEFYYNNIYKLQYKRKNSLSRGFLFGLICGVTSGAIIGLATYKKTECPPGSLICIDFGPGANALAGALVGSLGGGLIGMAVGASSRKTFSINYKKENFNEFKISLLQKVYGN